MPFPPYAHQVEAFARSRDQEAFAYLMGMRTGKTKTTIDDWMDKVANRHVQDLVVLAPAGVYKVWLTELDKHIPSGFEYDRGIWDSRSNNVNRRDLAQLLKDRGKPRALLVNTEALSSSEVTIAKELLYEFMKTRKSFMAVDESTAIKNPISNRTFTICALGTIARMKRILSGLPTPNTPLDAYAQFAFLNPAILGFEGSGQGHEKFLDGYRKFYRHHAVVKQMRVGARRVEIVVGYRHEEEIREKILPHSYRKTLRECSDVPEKLYVPREVELTAEQRKAYAELKAYMTTQLESGEYVSPDQVVTCMLRLHQVCCGHVVDDLGVLHSIKTNRPRAMEEVLQEHDGKAIIWCSYDHDVRLVSDFLRRKHGDRSVAQFWGGNNATRETDNRRFQEDPSCRYMVATPSAGGRGRNWSVADLMIYYSNTENLEHRDQSEERASSVGQEDRVTVVDLITRGTIEEKIVKSLREKINMAGSITGDSWRQWVV